MRTLNGRDLMARLTADTGSNGSGNYAPANWIGLSAEATAPAVGDTVLAGELTGGTMARKQASYSHTNGTSSYTLIVSFTSDRIVTVTKYGVFNSAYPGGTMAFEQAFSEAVIMKVGDSISVADSVTL